MLRYIKGTLHLSLFFGASGQGISNFSLEGYADADFGGSEDSKSTSGFLFKLNDCLVLWSTKKQETVALSTCEAEYVSLTLAASDLLWLEKLLADFQVDLVKPSVIFEDNQSCIESLKRPEHRRLKHMNI